MPSIYGYARVSTTQQADEGESLGAQERQIAAWCMMRDVQLTASLVERGVSGSVHIAERPEGRRLLDMAKRGDFIVASKLDRLFRSALDALQVMESLQKRGVELVLLDLGNDPISNGLSKLFLTIAAAFAEAERDRIRERVAGVKKDQRERGRYLGGKVPFGWRVAGDGAMVEVEAEQAAIRRAVALRQGGATLRAIHAALAEDGHTLALDTLHKALKRAGVPSLPQAA